MNPRPGPGVTAPAPAGPAATSAVVPARYRRFDLAMALQQAALSAVTRLDSDLGQAMTQPGTLPEFPASPSRVFLGTPDQIRAVRRYVRTGFAGHAAAPDAELVASELATNAACPAGSSWSTSPGSAPLTSRSS